MRQAYVAPDIQSLRDQLNRPAARTWAPVVSLSDAVFEATQNASPYTAYLNVLWPIEDGTVLRSARLIPFSTVSEVTGAVYATVTVGVKRGAKFDALGSTYDTRTKALTAGTPINLVLSESRVAVSTGIVVRVVQAGWPSPALLGSSIQFFFGFEG